MREINIQNTTVHTFDGLDIVIPNGEVVGNQLINWTKKDPYFRLHVPFGVAYGSDRKKVCEIVEEAARKVPATVTGNKKVRDPEVWLTEFGSSSLNFELIVWVNVYRSRGRNYLRSQYLAEIHQALADSNITIPFPQQDLYIKSVPENFMVKK